MSVRLNVCRVSLPFDFPSAIRGAMVQFEFPFAVALNEAWASAPGSNQTSLPR